MSKRKRLWSGYEHGAGHVAVGTAYYTIGAVPAIARRRVVVWSDGTVTEAEWKLVQFEPCIARWHYIGPFQPAQAKGKR